MIRRIRSSLNLKVFLSTTLMLFFVCLTIYTIIMIFMPRNYKFQKENELGSEFALLTTKLQGLTYDEAYKMIFEFCIKYNVKASISSEGGDINNIGSSSSSEVEDGGLYDILSSIFFPSKTGYSYSIMSSGIYLKDSDEEFIISASLLSTKAADESLEIFVNMFPYMMGLIFVLSLVCSFLYSRVLTKPIIELSNVSKRISELDLTWQCKTSRIDEIGVLSKNLNYMARKLDSTLSELKTTNSHLTIELEREKLQTQQRRDFFNAVSHELKTPLTIIKGQLEGMIYNIGKYNDRDTYLQRCLETACTMDSMVKEILSISRMEESQFQLRLCDVDLSQMIESCICQQETFAEMKGIVVKRHIEPEVMINADSGLLNKAFSNILNNGIVHSPSETEMSVSLSVQGDCTVLEVENCGVNIDEEQISELFQPFYRLEKSRNRISGGSGLGLYIVKIIFELHKISYKIENTDKGVRFTAWFFNT